MHNKHGWQNINITNVAGIYNHLETNFVYSQLNSKLYIRYD